MFDLMHEDTRNGSPGNVYLRAELRETKAYVKQYVRGRERRARPPHCASCELAADRAEPLWISAAGEIPSTGQACRSGVYALAVETFMIMRAKAGARRRRTSQMSGPVHITR